MVKPRKRKIKKAGVRVVGQTDSYQMQTTQLQGKQIYTPILWVVSIFLMYLTIFYCLYAIKFSNNLVASSLILLILGALAYFTCPLTLKSINK